MASELNPTIAYTPEDVAKNLQQIVSSGHEVGNLMRIDDWYAVVIAPAISDPIGLKWLALAGAEYGGQIKDTDLRHGSTEGRSVIKFRMKG